MELTELTKLTWWERLIIAARLRSMATIIPAALIPVGIIGLAMGESSSRAFSELEAGPVLAHGFGALLAIGGALVVLGLGRSDAFVESIGLTLLSGGAFTYAVGVLLGLGWQGAIAGGLALSISAGALGRVFALADTGKAAEHNEQEVALLNEQKATDGGP